MKRILPILTILALGLVSTAFAESKGKEITLTGQGECLKCNLKKSETCQSVLSVEKNGKTTVYTIADSEATKGFHEAICKAPKKATVTATCKKEGDKLVLTASKVEFAK